MATVSQVVHQQQHHYGQAAAPCPSLRVRVKMRRVLLAYLGQGLSESTLTHVQVHDDLLRYVLYLLSSLSGHSEKASASVLSWCPCKWSLLEKKSAK